MRSFALALFVLMFAASAAGADTPPQPSPLFRADADTVRADEQNSVNVDFTLINPLPGGVYCDSLFLIADEADRGETGLPKKSVLSLQSLAHLLAPASGGEEQHYSWSALAPFEHGTLTFRYVGHDAQKQRLELTTRVVLAGGVLGDAYPSEMLGTGAKAVEIVRVPAQGAGAAVPGVLLVHGDGSHARRMLAQANALSQRGWNVIAVSQPGYGLSAGKRDWAGPATIAALSAACDALKKSPGVDAKKVFVYGIGRGATAALLLAAQRSDLAGVAAVSAEHDLWATYRAGDAAKRAAIEAEAGRDSAAWKLRSPLLHAARVKALACIVSTADEDSTCRAAARAFATAVDRVGARTDIHIADAKHRVTRAETSRIVMDFIRRANP